MSLTIEGNPKSILNKWPLLLDTNTIKSKGIAWLFKENGVWNLIPRITGNVSQFYNAIFFLRFSLPFGIFTMFRWKETSNKKAFLQLGIGWKLNGRFGITARIQSDDSAEAGESGPNYGQAKGFEYGTH